MPHSDRDQDAERVTPSVKNPVPGAGLVRIRCRAVFLDAGGVIVLPHRDLVAASLARVGIDIDRSAVAHAHYRAASRLDSDPRLLGAPDAYPLALCSALGVADERLAEAVAAVSQLADRSISGKIMWSEAAPQAQRTIAALRRAGIAVFVVTNSDGHAAENLRDAAICQTTAGADVPIAG